MDRARSGHRPRSRPLPAPPAGGAGLAPPLGSHAGMAREAELAACLEAVLGSRSSANRVFELLEPLAVRAGPGRAGKAG